MTKQNKTCRNCGYYGNNAKGEKRCFYNSREKVIPKPNETACARWIPTD